MGYTDLIDTMWLDIWGNSELGALVIVICFAALCYKRGYNVMEGSIVILPVISGIVLSGSLPTWVTGLFLVGVGGLWGMFLLRITGLKS